MTSRVAAPTLAFNRGVVSPLALARTDIERMAMSAEIQTNWMPRSLGSMMLRAGQQHLHSTKDNAFAVCIPFIFASDDLAIIELTDGAMRIIVDDEPLSRESVATAFTNGSFGSDLTGWSDNDEAGATSAWAAGGYMSLVGTGDTAAIRRQTLSVAGGDQNEQHTVIVDVLRGPVSVNIGTSSGGDQLLSAINLGAGIHYLTFTPTTGSAYVEISSYSEYAAFVASVSIASAGDLSVPSPWGFLNLRDIRFAQSADVTYIACKNISPYKIERRSNNSWSIVKFQPTDGPFRNTNPSATTLTPSGVFGDITITSSRPLFVAGHTGALFSIDSVGQFVSSNLSAESTFTNEIRVTGVEDTRQFTITRSGTWSATLTLQRSVGAPGAWVDVNTYTTNGSATYNDELDNQVIYYRIGIKAGEYTSGTAVVALEFSGGSLTGIVQIKSVTNSTTAEAIVLRDLGGTDASVIWSEGSWSDLRGYPSAVALYEGRLWWAGKGGIYGSISDAYESYDQDEEGDSGVINRSIGYGPVDNINWLLPVNRLIMGAESAEISVRSTSFDEPLTPTNFNLKNASTQGSSPVPAVVVDTKGIFVQKSGSRVYELAYSSADFDYGSNELTVLAPQIGEPSIVRIAVQRQPDTRIHCVRSDGRVAIQVYDRAENVLCWVLYETDGEVEEAVVLPGTIEDSVYYVVKRTIGGNTVRYLEKWAQESECQGGLLNKQADSFVVYDGVATTTITGLHHLGGETVVVWADGVDVGTKVVSGGAVTLDTAASKVVVGLGYTALYKSTKLAYGAQMGTSLSQRKIIKNLALILYNTHIGGITFGQDFDHLDSISLEVNGEIVSEDTILESYDADAHPLNGVCLNDARLCLRAAAPRPVTVLAAIIGLEVNEKV